MSLGFLKHLKENILKPHKAELVELGDEVVLIVAPKNLLKLLRTLRDDTNCLFAMLISICGVDYPHLEKRFEVVYNLLSLKNNIRIRIKVKIGEKEEVPSAGELYNSATWYERETYDMYGIKFSDAKDLRRILTDYGFKYYPLRKDFPLTGYDEVRYDLEKKQVVYEPVSLDQEYRDFDSLSPWEGGMAKQILPGDEKAYLQDEEKNG